MSSLGTEATIGLFYQPQMTDWHGKPNYSEKTCPSATLSTTNPTSLDPGSKPAANRLSYGTAPEYVLRMVLRNATAVLLKSIEELVFVVETKELHF
jgi:hypothetical protein